MSFTLSQERGRVLYYGENTGAPMTDEYLTHEEMLEIAAQREAENDEEETTEEDETK